MITKLISIFQHKMRTDNLVLGSKSCALPDWYKVGICFTQVATTCCVVRRNWIRATTRCRHSLSQADTPLPTKWTPARARICNRHRERFENEQGEPDLFQVSGVVLRRGCRRCGSKDSFRIPTPPSAIRPAKTHGPDLTRNI